MAYRVGGKLIALCGMVGLIAGCASVQSGQPARDPALTPNADGAIVSLLATGNYATKPSPVPATAGDRGALVESQRMADFVVLPSDVDNTITGLGNLVGFGTAAPLPTAVLAAQKVSGGQDILQAHNYIAGFAVQRITDPGSGPGKAMTAMVARFPDAGAAAAVAAQMSALAPPRGTRTPLPIPRHPEAFGSTFDASDGAHYVESYCAHGPFLLYQFVNSNESLDVAASLVASTLDLQGPLIDKFSPTDPAHLADLPTDPTGLYAMALPDDPDSDDVGAGSYGVHGALAFEPNTVTLGRIYSITGVDAVARGKAVLYRTKDAASARRFNDILAQEAAADKVPTLPPVTGLTQSHCYQGTSNDRQPVYQCVVNAGRYVFRVYSFQKTDLDQQAAAQYVVLTAPR